MVKRILDLTPELAYLKCVTALQRYLSQAYLIIYKEGRYGDNENVVSACAGRKKNQKKQGEAEEHDSGERSAAEDPPAGQLTEGGRRGQDGQGVERAATR